MTEWLLIETFGGDQGPTVMAQGHLPKWVAVDKFFRRERDRTEVRAVLDRVRQSGKAEKTTGSDGRITIAHPLVFLDGKVHGVYLWRAHPDEQPPPRDGAGAWKVNLTRYTTERTDDLLWGVYGIAEKDREHIAALSELFSAKRQPTGTYDRIQTNADEATALGKLLKSRPGDVHQATWTVYRDDSQERRAVNYALRIMAEPNENGTKEIVGRGLTQDLGPAESTAGAPPMQPLMLAQLIADATEREDEWRAILNLETLQLLRWFKDRPMPGVAWERNGTFPPRIRRLRWVKEKMVELVRTTGKADFVVEVRATDGGWMPVAVAARLLFVPGDTGAGLAILTRPADPDGRANS